MTTFVERMVGAAKLDAATTRRSKPTARDQAGDRRGRPPPCRGRHRPRRRRAGPRGRHRSRPPRLGVWAWLIYLIGTRWLPEPRTQADTGELLRTIGFATSPGILRVVGRRAGPRPRLVIGVTAVWTLVASGRGRAPGARLSIHGARRRRLPPRLARADRLPRRCSDPPSAACRREVESARHGRPGALRAAERLHGRRAVAAVLRRVLRGARADPHRLLAHQDHRRRSCCSTPACRRGRCPGLMRNDPLARFTEEDLLVHRLDALGLESDNVDAWW